MGCFKFIWVWNFCSFGLALKRSSVILMALFVVIVAAVMVAEENSLD